MTSLQPIASRVFSELDAWRPDFQEALAKREGEEAARAILEAARAKAEGMLASVPDPGVLAPQMRVFTISGLLYVALYLALAARGYDAPRAWEICEEATRLHFARMRGAERKLASAGMFSWPMKALTRWLGRRSKRAPIGGWEFDYVEGDGTFDYGTDYRRCAIRDLAVAHGAAEFAPYICTADIAGSEEFGWGLQRTQTIAQGGERCDFRFRKGGATEVRVRLPMIGKGD
ncbi:L-2-amino-thiazoline-4-carboxylic acid hydrolase [Polyangium aurulentum]|uniref:L-2-amino-thiazoline-4-carboxylic acid hydrolase n=1 Tax=Polyangium aurulentum TaxID=2567896 RepID=UPI0010AE14F4|nr:L-2-amino-thiazoline-4-carboxylic acid hydrolase [Polyangium aurulentum]UQA56197.1 L-2-amino-thiazoline-4-carboxylic acid hydrolase [Polyangium aurulentum]